MRRLGFLVAVIFVTALAGSNLAWSEKPSTEAKSGVTLIYVNAWNCPPCFVWGRKYKPVLKQWLESAAGQTVSFRVVEAYTYNRIGEDGSWPADIRWVKDRLKLRRGAPRWIIVADGQIILHGFGIRGWTNKIWPRLRQVVAEKRSEG